MHQDLSTPTYASSTHVYCDVMSPISIGSPFRSPHRRSVATARLGGDGRRGGGGSRLSPHIHAAVHGDCCAGDELRHVAEQKERCIGDIVGATDTAEDEGFGDFFTTDGVQAWRCHFGVGRAGATQLTRI